MDRLLGDNIECTVMSHMFCKDDVGRVKTYEDLQFFCARVSEVITERRLVVVCADRDIETIMMYASCVYNRIPVMVLDGEYDGKVDYASILDKYKPAYIWKKRTNFESGIVYEYEDYALLETAVGCDYEICDDLALLLSTSGSTGSCKFVRISYENLRTNTLAIIESLGISKEDRAMITLPLAYTYGLSVVNTHIMSGAVLLVTKKKIVQKGFGKFAKENGCTSISGVPMMYDLLRVTRYDFLLGDKLRIVTVAGGKVSAVTEKYMLEMAVKKRFDFAVMYGQTEATARMSCHILNKNVSKAGSAGRAVKNGAFHVQAGELVYTGPNVSLGYAESCMDLVKGDENHGVLYTGDMGVIDSDGYVYIKGRKSRFAKIKGYRMNLDELQGDIRNTLDIEVICMQRDDCLVIFFEKNFMSDAKIDNIYRYLEKEKGIHKRYTEIRLIERFPRTVSGKISYKELGLV